MQPLLVWRQTDTDGMLEQGWIQWKRRGITDTLFFVKLIFFTVVDKWSIFAVIKLCKKHIEI
jgi:hypothetical protein